MSGMQPLDPVQPATNLSLKTYTFTDDGILPNNPQLPVVLYPAAMRDNPYHIKQLFHINNWFNSWEDGIFDYHHYHSNTHEALGVITGTASLQLGGDQGIITEVFAGDVLVLPAGTAHRRLSCTPDFLVVGAYPGGMGYNTRREQAADRLEALAEIPQVPLPSSDPLYGASGPLLTVWSPGT